MGRTSCELAFQFLPPASTYRKQADFNTVLTHPPEGLSHSKDPARSQSHVEPPTGNPESSVLGPAEVVLRGRGRLALENSGSCICEAPRGWLNRPELTPATSGSHLGRFTEPQVTFHPVHTDEYAEGHGGSCFGFAFKLGFVFNINILGLGVRLRDRVLP